MISWSYFWTLPKGEEINIENGSKMFKVSRNIYFRKSTLYSFYEPTKSYSKKMIPKHTCLQIKHIIQVNDQESGSWKSSQTTKNEVDDHLEKKYYILASFDQERKLFDITMCFMSIHPLIYNPYWIDKL
jgi:hypothetical protein